MKAVYLEEEKHTQNAVADCWSEDESDFLATFKVKFPQNSKRNHASQELY